MGAKEDFIKKMEEQLEQWNLEMKKFKAKADQAQAGMKAKYYEEIERLKKKQADLRGRLDKASKAGGEAWRDFSGGIEEAWKDLKKGLEDLFSKSK